MQDDDKIDIRRIAFLVSITLFGTSLFCPVFFLKEGNNSFLLGFVCLLFGWGSNYLAWWANPLYFAAIISYYMKQDLIAAILSCSALAVAFTTLSIKQIEKNEAGHMTDVEGFNVGFYLWLSSMLVALVASVIYFLKPKGQVDSFER